MATWPTVTDDDGTGTTGTILDQALFNSVRDYIGAAWTDVAHAAGNFTGSGSMTWTVDSGDQGAFRYIICGKTMTVAWVIASSDVGGTASTALRIAIPGGVTLNGSVRGVHWYADAGTEGFGGVIVSGTNIELYKSNSSVPWTLTTGDNTNTYGQITFEIA